MSMEVRSPGFAACYFGRLMGGGGGSSSMKMEIAVATSWGFNEDKIVTNQYA